MQKLGLNRMAHPMTSKEKEEFSAVLTRMKKAADRMRQTSPQAQATEKDILKFPKEFYDYFEIERVAS